MLTQAARRRSTSAFAILRASSCDEVEVRTSLLLVIYNFRAVPVEVETSPAAGEVITSRRVHNRQHGSSARKKPALRDFNHGNADQVWHIGLAGGNGRGIYVCQCAAGGLRGCALHCLAE